MSYDFTPTDVIEVVRVLAASEPNFVYEKPGGDKGNCVYWYDEAPSCIIGQALFALGVEDELLQEADNDGDYNLGMAADDLLLSKLGVGDTEKDRRHAEWLRLVQTSQDNGLPWGQAVELADQGMSGSYMADGTLRTLREFDSESWL